MAIVTRCCYVSSEFGDASHWGAYGSPLWHSPTDREFMWTAALPDQACSKLGHPLPMGAGKALELRPLMKHPLDVKSSP